MIDRAPWPPGQTEPAVRHPDAPPPGTQLGEHYTQCFGCGSGVSGGLHVQGTVGDDASITTTFLVGTEHQGAPGLAHGGVLTAAFDETLGMLNVLRQIPAVTGKLETEFLRPVPVGATLHIVATLDGIAGRKIYSSATGRLDSPDGALALRARALFIEVQMAHFAKYSDQETLKGTYFNP